MMSWCNVMASIVIVVTTFSSLVILSSANVSPLTVENETADVCSMKHSCYRMGCTARQNRLCQCDSLCQFFDDCCHDYNRSCAQEAFDSFRGFEKSNLKCVGDTIGDISSWQWGYWMVTSCPDWFHNHDVITQCQTLISDSMVSRIPVTDKVTRTLYRNVHCGICNGVNVSMLTAWKVEIKQCQPSDIKIQKKVLKVASIEEKLSIFDTNCSVTVTPPHFLNQFPDPRPCFPFLEGSCRSQELQLAFGAGCDSYTAVVQNKNTFYKNPHCFICSLDTNKEDTIKCSHTMPFYIMGDQRGVQISRGFLAPLSIIMDFGSENTMRIMKAKTTLQEEKMTCPTHQVYNPDTVLCQPLICHAGYKLVDSGCVVDINNDSATWCNNTKQQITLTADITTHDTADCVDSVKRAETAQCVKNLLAEAVQDTVVDNWKADHSDVDCHNQTIQLPLLSFCSSDDTTLHQLTQLHSLHHHILNNIMDECEVRKLTFTQNHAETTTCQRNKKLIHHFTIKATDGVVQIQLGNSSSHYNLQDTNIITEYTLSRSSGKRTTLEVCMNASALAFCSMVKLNESSFTLLNDNSGTIVYSPTGKEYGINDYLNQSDGSVLVCSSFTSNYSLFHNVTFFSYSKTQVILSTTGSILSLVACTLTFITYCVFPTLRNRTISKAIMSLVVALFISQVLLLFGGLATSLSQLCSAVAAMAHYFWLTAFCWMNVLSLDLYQTFGSGTKLQRLHNDTTTLLLYMLYAWGLPLLVVIPCIVVHFCRCTRFQYGSDDACWIKDGLTNLLAFGLPVAILVIINIILYCKTVAGIRTTKKDAAGMQVTTKQISETRKKVQELFIYIKIGSLMGFTWIFSYAAAFSHLEALWYIVIILNSLQGVFIFFSFMCNERVYNLWCKKLSGERGGHGRGKQKGAHSDEAGTQSTSLYIKKTNTIKERPGSKKLLETPESKI